MIISGSADLLAMLNDVIQEDIPKGFMTVKDHAKKSGRSISTMHILLKKGVESGLVESRKFYIILDTGRRFPVVHYRVKGQKA